MIAGIFVYGGIDSLRNATGKVPVAEDVAQAVAEALPVHVPPETEQLIKINGAVQVGAGLLLALGKFPRVAALALGATLVPTTAAAHRFWEADEASKPQQTIHFLKNASILGGLILAALDTQGRPSLTWRAKRAARSLSAKSGELAGQLSDVAGSLPHPHR